MDGPQSRAGRGTHGDGAEAVEPEGQRGAGGQQIGEGHGGVVSGHDGKLGGEGGGGDQRAGVRLEEIRAHARHVAHVVTDVVGDHGGVARVVLGDALLDLAHQIRADVGGLRGEGRESGGCGGRRGECGVCRA
jgi:hypothetical protein